MYTRHGDKGDTGLFGAKRVPKDSKRIEAYGTIDELNSFIGLAIASSGRKQTTADLRTLQNILFVAGGDLASEGSGDRVPRITDRDVEWVEGRTDSLLAELPRLANFILPGGSELAARLHVARTVCRRAERRVVTLATGESVNPQMVPFLNRLSSYLFNLARYANAVEGIREEPWKKRK